jgi:tRNA(fMet)-specific endonuclease VapC
MIRYILDTDHLSLVERKHPSLKKYLDSIQPDEIATTIISAEEQLRGRFLQIRRFTSGIACVEAYRRLRETIDRLKATTILDFDVAAELIDQSLRNRKLRLGTQDRRIAAIALANKCVLVTRNQSDFGQIPGLVLQDWTK